MKQDKIIELLRQGYPIIANELLIIGKKKSKIINNSSLHRYSYKINNQTIRSDQVDCLLFEGFIKRNTDILDSTLYKEYIYAKII